MLIFKRNYKYLQLFILTLLMLPYAMSELRGSLKNPIEVSKILNIRFPINSSGDDFSPSLTADGKILLFNSKLENEQSHNIYISRYKNQRWTTPEYFEILNSKYDNDETPYISPDGTVIVFSSDRQMGKDPYTSNQGKNRITYNIYFSRKIDGKWSKPEPIPGDVNTEDNERSPCLSPDKKTLYFTRWPFKNIKKSTILRASLKGGIYTDVKMLPPPVNTGNYEIAFTPSHLRSGFYFASRRPKGFGGWDIYFAYYVNGQFTMTVNLGPEINSPSNELFMTEVGNRLYFCTNREGGFGKYDIYFADIRTLNIPKLSELEKDSYYNRTEEFIDKKRVEVPPEKRETITGIKPVEVEMESETREIDVRSESLTEAKAEKETKTGDTAVKTRLKIRVVKKQRMVPISARFNIHLKDSSDPEEKPLRSITRSSSRYGWMYIAPKDDVNWIEIKVAQAGYKPVSKIFKVIRGEDRKVTIELTPLQSGPVVKKHAETSVKAVNNGEFVFRPVYFGTNSTQIKLEYYPYIHNIINYMRRNSSVKLEIIGHSDKFGSIENKKMISYQRAQTVRDYMIKFGLDQKRFDLKGVGSHHPAVYANNIRYSDFNRRVDFRIISNNEPDGYSD